MTRIGLKFKGEYGQPAYQTGGSVGFDLCAQPGDAGARVDKHYVNNFGSVDSWELPPGVCVKIPTGCFLDVHSDFSDALSVPCLMVTPRSSLATRLNVGLLNTPGIIDPDYPGEIHVMLINHSDKVVSIPVGERIAQAFVIETQRVYGVPIKEKKRDGGFGSTGRV